MSSNARIDLSIAKRDMLQTMFPIPQRQMSDRKLMPVVTGIGTPQLVDMT